MPDLFALTTSTVVAFTLVGGPKLLRPHVPAPALAAILGAIFLTCVLAARVWMCTHRAAGAEGTVTSTEGSHDDFLVPGGGLVTVQPALGDGNWTELASAEAGAACVQKQGGEGPDARCKATAPVAREAEEAFVPLMVMSACSLAFARTLLQCRGFDQGSQVHTPDRRWWE